MVEAKCPVPGCDNTLTEEQRNRKISVCSDCEVAEMHLCESCGKKISAARIKDGATICRECEANPTDLGEEDMQNYEEEYIGGRGSEKDEESEDFMV